MACGALARDYWRPWAAAIYQQMLRASLSVQLNIAEGYAVRSVGRTRQHWITAYGSCVETIECLDLLSRMEAIPKEDGESISQRAREASWLVLGLLKMLASHR